MKCCKKPLSLLNKRQWLKLASIQINKYICIYLGMYLCVYVCVDNQLISFFIHISSLLVAVLLVIAEQPGAIVMLLGS